MTKVIRIVEDNHVTGVVYDTIEITDLQITQKQRYNQMVAKATKARMKQLRNSRTRQK